MLWSLDGASRATREDRDCNAMNVILKLVVQQSTPTTCAPAAASSRRRRRCAAPCPAPASAATFATTSWRPATWETLPSCLVFFGCFFLFGFVFFDAARVFLFFLSFLLAVDQGSDAGPAVHGDAAGIVDDRRRSGRRAARLRHPASGRVRSARSCSSSSTCSSLSPSLVESCLVIVSTNRIFACWFHSFIPNFACLHLVSSGFTYWNSLRLHLSNLTSSFIWFYLLKLLEALLTQLCLFTPSLIGFYWFELIKAILMKTNSGFTYEKPNFIWFYWWQLCVIDISFWYSSFVKAETEFLFRLVLPSQIGFLLFTPAYLLEPNFIQFYLVQPVFIDISTTSSVDQSWKWVSSFN